MPIGGARLASSATTRRELFSGIGLLAAGALISKGDLAAQDTVPGRIDLHHHFGSPGWLATLAARDGKPNPGFTSWFGLNSWKDYSPSRSIEDMDRGGVAAAVVSLTAPGVWFGDIGETKRLARDLNEYAAAKMVGAYKGRFGLFAVLPLPDVDASLREIEYAFDTLKADGVGLLTSVGSKYLGDKAFTPVFDELNRRKAIVYTHPIDAPCCQNLLPDVNVTTVEYNTDTSRTIISLIASGTASRCADTQFIFSHGGGTIVSLAGRFLGAAASAESLAKPAEPDSRLHHLRRFYYDTAGSANPVNMQSLKMLVSASQIVFGTDHPFGRSANIAANLQTCGFSADELRGVDRENALKLLPRFRS